MQKDILEQLKQTVCEIQERRVRIAELGGKLEPTWWMDDPMGMAFSYFDEWVELLRKEQHDLEQKALASLATAA